MRLHCVHCMCSVQCEEPDQSTKASQVVLAAQHHEQYFPLQGVHKGGFFGQAELPAGEAKDMKP